MQQAHQSYYQPYLSDSDDSDSSSITSSDTSTDGIYPIGSSDGVRQAGAVSENAVTVITNRIQPRTGNSKAGLEYSVYDISGVLNVPTGTKFDTSAGTYTSILMINSLDRDRNVYAQPTFFTIRLPRTYRNVSQFSITQMKLLSSFYYFRPGKENVSLQVVEQGRTIVSNGQTVDNVITVTIRTGSYDINALLAELQLQLNRTPLFFYFPNGINDFISLFTAAGDLSVGFNQPGDNFYNSLQGTYIANPTMTQIVTTFFPSTNAGLTTYTYGNVLIAYYYPVLYEQVNDPQYSSQLNLVLTTTTLLPGETVTSRILYTFQGLNDPVILELINQNTAVLDAYRTLNTFLNSLVNEYSCTYATNNNNISISTNRLNTSLYNLITNQTTIALANQLNTYGLTTQQYSNLQASNLRFNAVFTDMYNRMQTAFATNFAVNFGTYSATFYTNVSNVLFLQNGIGATGVTTGYSLALLQSGTAQINSSTQNLQSSPGYWPQISTQPPAEHPTDLSSNVIFIGSGIQNRYSLNPSYSDISGTNLNVPYNFLNQTMQTGTNFIDNSGNLYMNPSFGAGDCVTPVYNSGYTVFRFRSFVRQTLQVETLPLPYYYRTPVVVADAFGPPLSTYFNISYNYINNPQLTRTDISSVPLTFAQPYISSFTHSTDYVLTVQTPVKYYSFVAPKPAVNDASGYKYTLTIGIQSVTSAEVLTPFVSPISAFFYHDQGAFFADISGYRNENPYNYLQTVTADTTVNSVTFTNNVIAGDTYYLIVRSQAISFQNTRIKVVAYYPQTTATPFVRYQYLAINPYATPELSFPVVAGATYQQVWASLYDTDFMKLPTSSNLQGLDPSSATFNQYLPLTEYAIGYDSNGVSTDLTDYRGYQSNAPGNRPSVTFRTDPINQFTFQSLSPYYSASNSYFYTGSSNALLRPISNTVYTPTTVAQREYKIVHWYDQQYIAPQAFQSTLSKGASIPSFTRVVDASYGALTGFTYTASSIMTSNGISKTISTGMNFDQGVVGFGFLPSASQWEIDQVIFKTAYMPGAGGDSFTDPNKAIRHLAIFPTTTVTGSFLTDLSMNQALYLLDYTSSIQYTAAIQKTYNGFDTVGGTYWQFKINSNFVSPLTQKLGGFTPSNTYLFDSNAYYSVIPFDSNGCVAQFYTLMGSYVPYPTVSKPVPASTVPAASNYYTSPPPGGVDFYIPQQLSSFKTGYYYPTDSNLFQSRYEQSIPIQTNLLHTQKITDPTSLSNGFSYFTTAQQIVSLPNQTVLQSPNTVAEMTTLINSGPYFFMLNSHNYIQDANATNTPTLFYVASNYNVNIHQNLNGTYTSTLGASGQPIRVMSNIVTDSLCNLNYTTPIDVRGSEIQIGYNGVNVNNTKFQSNLFMGITTTNKITNPLSNMLVLTLGSVYCSAAHDVPPPETVNGPTYDGPFGFDFILSKLYVSTGVASLTPVIFNQTAFTFSPIFCSNVLSNGISSINYPYTVDGTRVYSSTIDCYSGAAHKVLTKLYYTDTNLLYFQFHTVNRGTSVAAPPYPNSNSSYFCMYDSNTSKVVNMFPTNGFIFPLNQFNLFQYDTYLPQPTMAFPKDYTTPRYANTSYYADPFNSIIRNTAGPSNLYLDWTVDSQGAIYVMNLPSNNTQYFNISKFSLLSNQGGIYPTQINFNTGINIVGSIAINSLTFSNYGYGVFNGLKIDQNGNIYMQQQFDMVQTDSNIPWSSNLKFPPNIGDVVTLNPEYSYPQLQYLWNSYANSNIQTGANNALWTQYAKIPFYTVQSLTVGTTDVLFTVNRQTLGNAAVNSYNIYEGNPKSDLLLGIQSNTLGNPAIFSQESPYAGINTSNTSWQVVNMSGVVGNPNPPYGYAGWTRATGNIVFNYSYNNQSYSFTYLLGQGGNQGTPCNLSEAFNNNLISNNVPYRVAFLNSNVGYRCSWNNNVSMVSIWFMTNYLFSVNSLGVTLIATVGSSTYISPAPAQVWPTLTSPQYGAYFPQYPTIPYIYPTITQPANTNYQMWGSSEYGIDLLPYTACNAWQIMYPAVKIVMKKLQSSSSPITNTTDLTTYPSYAHTAIFYYDNYSDLSNDIFNKFGSESKARFKNYDVSSGYGFNSYMYNIPLDPYKGNTNDICGNTGYAYVAVRGYSPTEKFDCLTRFYLPGQYSFGFLSLKDISNETTTVIRDLSNSPLVNQTYLNTLATFNSNFTGNFTYGSNVIAGFPGSNYTFNGFGSFLANYISIYNANLANATLLGTINSNVTASVSAYIKYYLTPILPTYVQTRARFTDPLLFSILFKSALTPQYALLEDEWGLGWNLGFPKADTPYNTIQKAPSFFKILDDYIYLKLNKEFTMNRMDASAKENLAITHEPQGQTNQYAAKLLLSGFGAYAQTMVQNPITFNPVLTSMDKLTFQWVDTTGTQINNADCEWNAVVQINEQVTQATVTSTIPKAN
jgi:hypothetical protein